MKKFLSVLLIALMIVSMGISAYAEDSKVTITDSNNTTASYDAYQLLYSENIQAQEDGQTKNYYVYEPNAKYTAIILAAIDDTTVDANGIVAYIKELDEKAVQALAQKIYELIEDDDTITPDAQLTAGTAKALPEGYWLFAETSTPDDGVTEALMLVDTVGKDDMEILVKNDALTLVKVIVADGGTNLTDAVSASVGDTIIFALNGSVDKNIATYTEYSYVFTDTLQKSFTYDATTLEVYVDGELLENTEETTYYTTAATTDTATGATIITVSFADLTKIQGISASSIITVVYEATLNENVEYVNTNEAYVTAGGGKTPSDIVTVFSFNLNVYKLGEDKQPLTGAGFTLYKYDEETEAYVQVGDELVGTADAPISEFNFIGLGEGKYKLEESTIPEKHRGLEDLFFEVVATYESTADGQTVKTLKIVDEDEKEIDTFTVDIEVGEFEVSVINPKDGDLPGTGGRGTAFFYITGSVLILAAAFIMIRKKAIA